MESAPRKKEFQLGQQAPRNAGEQIYYEKYGTVTPIPERTLSRKNNIQVCCILYIHMGIQLSEASRLTKVDMAYCERLRKKDKWDEFAQELAQLTRPSNLTLIKTHDIETIASEQLRRENTLEDLKKEEKRVLEEMKELIPSTQQHQRCVSTLAKIRELIGDVTGFTRFNKEMSAARQAGLTAAAKEAPNASQTRSPKGKSIDI